MNWDWNNSPRRVVKQERPPSPQRFRVPRPEVTRKPKQRVVSKKQERRSPSPVRRNDVKRTPGPDTIEAHRIVSDMNENDMRRVLVDILRESDMARAKAQDIHQQYGVREQSNRVPQPPPPAANHRKDLKKWDRVHDLTQKDKVKGHGHSRVFHDKGHHGRGFANVWSNHAGARRQEMVYGRAVDWGDTIRVDFPSEKQHDFRFERSGQ